jgi:hypothetical protein
MYGNPALPIKAPKQVTLAERRAHAREEIQRIISAQDSLRDQAAILLIGPSGAAPR